MHGQAKSIRFEYAALGVMILCVGLLYGMVLSGDSGEPSERMRAADGTLAGPRPVAVVEQPREIGSARPEKADLLAEGSGSADRSDSDPAGNVQLTEFQLGGARAWKVEVPRILVDTMPTNIAGAKSPTQRKRVFIELLLPLALRVNEQIGVERARLTEINKKLNGFFGTLDPDEREWLDDMRGRYRVETTDIDDLLRRVDVVPPSLALAQAAEESGWGTSRFAREANALFGQRTFTKGAGLVPSNRDDGEIHEVVPFDRLLDSVAAYMANLNSHAAYKEFRLAREHQRRTHGFLDGYDLAGTLVRYSERGADYVGTIQSIIDKNNLRMLDGARLRTEETTLVVDSDI